MHRVAGGGTLNLENEISEQVGRNTAQSVLSLNNQIFDIHYSPLPSSVASRVICSSIPATATLNGCKEIYKLWLQSHEWYQRFDSAHLLRVQCNWQVDFSLLL